MIRRVWKRNYNFSNLQKIQKQSPRDVLKKGVLEISQNSRENTCARVSFLINCRLHACNFIKKGSLAQGFSSEFCEISRNTFSYRTPQMTSSENTEIVNRSWSTWHSKSFLRQKQTAELKKTSVVYRPLNKVLSTWRMMQRPLLKTGQLTIIYK